MSKHFSVVLAILWNFSVLFRLFLPVRFNFAERLANLRQLYSQYKGLKTSIT